MSSVITTAPQIQTIFLPSSSFSWHGFQTDRFPTSCCFLHPPIVYKLGQGFSLIRFHWYFFLSTKASIQYRRAVGYYFRDCWISHWQIKSVMAVGSAIGKWTPNKDPRQDVCRRRDLVKCSNIRQKMILDSKNIISPIKIKHPSELTQQDLETNKQQQKSQQNTGNCSLRIRKQEPEFPHTDSVWGGVGVGFI